MTSFLRVYKWLLLLLISFLFAVFLFGFLSTSEDISPQNTATPTAEPSISIIITPSSSPQPSSEEDPGTDAHEEVKPSSSRDGLLSKESLPDDVTKFTFSSAIPSRPDILFTKGVNEDILFQRSVISTPVLLSNYLQAYGQSNQIVTGSKFYGGDANLYFYPDKGLAFIANPKVDRVLELHTFMPMSFDEYKQKYGDDIVNP